MKFRPKTFLLAGIGAGTAASLLLVVFLAGNLITDGSPLPTTQEAKIIVQSTDVAAGGTPAKPFDYATYTADATKGAKIAGKCKACHDLSNGGPNRVGPNLWGIVGSPVTHKADFQYSDGMKTAKTKYGTWTDEHLFAYLESPKDYVPGTKMQFPGLKKPEDRADLIAYLKTLK